MIRVEVQYYVTEGVLFDTHDSIGFWSWEHFQRHFNRLYKWRILFEIMHIMGEDYYTGNEFKDSHLYVIEPIKDNKPIQYRPYENMPSDHRRFIEALNAVIKERAYEH